MSHSNTDETLDLREKKKRKREGVLILLLAVLFVFLTFAEFRLTQVSKTLPFVTSIFFFGLLNINIIILIALMWLVFRNIGKLLIERRRRILGSGLKTKLVIAFFAFSIIPTLVLFIISALYINSSFDKWFSLKIQNTLQASLEITGTYYRNTEQTAMHFAEHISNGVGSRLKADSSFIAQTRRVSHPSWVSEYLRSQRELLALDAVEFYTAPGMERILTQRKSDSGLPREYPRFALDVLSRAFSGEKVAVVHHVGSGDLIRCLVPVYVESGAHHPILGVVAVDSYVPVSLVNKVDEIASVFDDYKETNPLKYPMKSTYLLILVMITLVIMFVAIWVGLYMAKELTVPVAQLVEGAQAVGAGDLDVTIKAAGHDEIAVLVHSFNKMTYDLRENRASLVQAGQDLEKRRLQLEAVLANIGTGVIAIDHQGVITTFNAAVSRLLEMSAESALNHIYKDVLIGEASPLVGIVQRAFFLPHHERDVLTESTQWNFHSGDSIKVLAAVATPLRQIDRDWGVVIVIDDMTHLIKGQREMAWREVARRIAHEIKNPLTPIKLSAQRLQRRFAEYEGKESEVLQECTDTIIRHTDELKDMVNEFSHFARFPEINPAPHDLNRAILEVIQLYRQAHADVVIHDILEKKLPIFDFDRDQMKRVVINLFDNAIAVLNEDCLEKEKKIEISTHYNDELKMVTIEIRDNGPGMSDELKARVFEPYFSTKKEGTGLGLAIAKRIVNDHDGFIRVRSAPQEGAQFVIELPMTHKSSRDRSQD